MKAKAQVICPEKIEVEINLRMTLGDWESLSEQLSIKWPSSELNTEIRNIVYEVKQTFIAKDK